MKVTNKKDSENDLSDLKVENSLEKVTDDKDIP